MASQAGVRGVRAAATRAALIAAGRQLFAQNGYHATGTPELAALAGVTRGALYHHFQDKEELFEVVFRQVADELRSAAGQAVAALTSDPWRQLQEGLQAFLRLVATNDEVQRILLLDGPVVFGWEKWRDVQSQFSLVYLVRNLEQLMTRGIIRQRSAGPLATLILAALYDAAMSIAHSKDPEGTREEVGGALSTLVEGLYVSEGRPRR